MVLLSVIAMWRQLGFCGVVIFWLNTVGNPRPALALNADPTKLTLATFGGWQAFEIISQGDTNEQNGYVVPGELDGNGAYLLEDDANTIRVLINHETGRACDTVNNATVTQVDLDRDIFRRALAQTLAMGAESLKNNNNQEYKFVRSFGPAWDTFVDDTGTVVQHPNPRFKLFCSSQAYGPQTFAALGDDARGEGFRDQLYLFGEERQSPPYGRLLVVDHASRTLYQISGAVGDATPLQGGNAGVMQDSFENVALLRTYERHHVVFLMSMDGGSKTLRLYVGHKNKGRDGDFNPLDFMPRNGLAFGSWYHLIGTMPTTQGESSNGTFSASGEGAMYAEKFEDVDTNPLNPTQITLGEEKTGIYILDFNLDFSSGLFNPGNSSFSIKMVVNHRLVPRFRATDNVLWTESDMIYVATDGAEAGVWEMKSDGSGLKEIAASINNGTDYGPSGMTDISSLVGYTPSSILLADTMNCGSSMSVLINPNAKLLETALPTMAPMAVLVPAPTPTLEMVTRAPEGDLCEKNPCDAVFGLGFLGSGVDWRRGTDENCVEICMFRGAFLTAIVLRLFGWGCGSCP